MNHIRQAFGEDADLYDVLGLKDRDEAEDPAKLRKAYFRSALKYHPDKQGGNTDTNAAHVAKEKFQAISFAYQVLKDPDKRAEYNETGHVDEEGVVGDDDDNDDKNKNWKDYFDLIFGKVSTSQIDAFAVKYKCSEEEQKDVLSEYEKWKGDLVKMLEFVILSEPLDTKRWVEDYIQPAVELGTVPDYDTMIKKSLKKLEAKMEKERNKKKNNNNNNKKSKKGKANKKKESSEEEEEDDDDEEESSGEEEEEEDCDVVEVVAKAAASDATETESDDDEDEVVVEASPVQEKKKKKKKDSSAPTNSKKAKAQKAKPTKAKVVASSTKKKKKKGGGGGGGNTDDLFAMIKANQASRAGGVMRSLGARYGVAMDDNDDDPLDDAEFDKIQARLNKNKKRKSR